jgi:uncharacterized protein YukJ
MHNEYCMFKGVLVNAAPFKPEYPGSPHYVVTVKDAGGKAFKIVINSASDTVGQDGNNNVYFYADLNFDDPLNQKLGKLEQRLYTDDFPKLDYWQDSSLLDIKRMRPIPYKDEEGNRVDVNDTISDVLTIDTDKEPQSLPYDNGSGQIHNRDFFSPTDNNVIVYGFGFLFQPKEDGLHETHMNQGNPRGRHFKENGAFQDGAVIVERAGSFAALFTAFQTQMLPTDARGVPVKGALPLPDFIRS